MKKHFLLLALLCYCSSAMLYAQKPVTINPNPYYSLLVNSVDKNGGVPLQSFINGRKGDTILLIGGRTTGLHNFSGTAFPFSTSNDKLMVYVPGNAVGKSKLYTVSVPATLPQQNRLQLASTNMQFCQDGDTLYSIGGYGFNGVKNNDSSYGTFNSFFAVNVRGLVNAIVANDTASTKLASYFTFSTQPSVTDSTMAVTGGELVKMGTDYYLVVGQDFQGKYGAGKLHYQRYTNTITRLHFNYTATSLTYNIVETITDPAQQFHRRDLNVVPVVAINGKPGIDVYGGVFTPTVNGGPYLNPIKVRANPILETYYTVDTSFVQYFNQYASAHVLMYDGLRNTMFASLLGGISLYDSVKTVNSHTPIQPSDTTMPWTSAISTIARNATGKFVEYASDNNTMPALIGAEARFIPYQQFLKDGSEEIIDYNKVVLYAAKNKTTVVNIGFLFGGIISSTEDGSGPTNSDPALYKVSVKINLLKKK